MKRILTVSALGLACGLASFAQAAEDPVTTSWAEPIDGTWLEEARWSNGVPAEGSIAEILFPGNYSVTMEYLVTDIPSVIRIGGGAALNVSCSVSTWQYPVELQEGGRLVISGKSRLTPSVFERIAFAGGAVEYAAAGVTNVWGEADTTLTNVNVRLAGNSRTGIGDNGVKGLQLGLVSTAADTAAKLAIGDTARLWLEEGSLALGCFGQRGVSELSVAAGRPDMELAFDGQPKALRVGYEGGTGRVVQAGARLQFTDGLYLGTRQGDWFDQALESRAFDPTGVYELSGGVAQVDGLAVTTADAPTGVLIGDGSRPGSSPSAYFTGEWRMTGGILDCRRAYLMIGLGKGEGRLEQSAGILRQNVKANDSYMAPAVLGWKGGSGVWRFTGNAQTEFGDGASLYIGGMDDSRLLRPFNWVTLYSIKSKGRLEVDENATFRAPALTVLGESGEGTIEIGPTGKFVGGTLRTTAGSPSTLKFTAGTAGFGSIRLNGAFEGDAALKIVVDFAGRSPVGKATLVEAASLSGIAAANVEVLNAPAEREVEIAVDGTSVVVGLKSGSLVIVR